MKSRVFNCDNCNKDSGVRNEGKDCYPYKQGWKYLYSLQIKPYPEAEANTFATNLSDGMKQKSPSFTTSNSYRNEFPGIRDKHFCSTKCLTKFIEFKVNQKKWKELK